VNLTLVPEFAASFVLVFVRIGTLVMLMPGIGDRAIPARARLSFALLLSLVLLPLVRPTLPAFSADMEPLIRLALQEGMIGLMLGAAVRITMLAVQLSGTIIAQQMGLSFSASVDPLSGVQNPTIGTFLFMTATMMIFALDLHHVSIRGMHDSYALLAPGDMPTVADAHQFILETFVSAFRVGVQISAPFLIFGIVFNMGLGVLSRLMPQLQVFFVAMPATIIIGTLILIGVIAMMMSVFTEHLSALMSQLIRR
jgi:flagellar biosynthesis protein FliR